MRTITALLALAVSAPAALAQSVTFSGSSINTYGGNNNPISASVTFTISGSNLLVLLTNTETTPTFTPSDVLSSVVWTMSPNTTLTPVSAVLGTGSSMQFYTGGTPITPTTNIGGEYAYNTTFSGGLAGFNHGISSSGFTGTFGAGNPHFGPDNLVGPPNVDGLNFGLVGPGSLAGANGGVTGSDGLVQSSVLFTLAGLGSGFSLDAITGVRFLYGTVLEEPSFDGAIIPLPPIAMSGIGTLLGLGAMAGFRRRR